MDLAQPGLRRRAEDAYPAAEEPNYLNDKARERYYKHEAAYISKGVNLSGFMFGV